jgi:hypothetical protein
MKRLRVPLRMKEPFAAGVCEARLHIAILFAAEGTVDFRTTLAELRET